MTDNFKEFARRVAAGQETTPIFTARELIGENEQQSVDRMLAEDPLGLRVEFAPITTGMMIKWREKRAEYIKGRSDDDIPDIEWWAITVKAAIVSKWFASPSDWQEGSVNHFPPSHTHWLHDLISLHQIELKRVPFLSG